MRPNGTNSHNRITQNESITMNVTLHAGDNRKTLRSLIDQGVRVHSVVTDPPYGLVSVQQRFGKEGAAPAKSEGNDGSFGRLSAGFMGKAWDGTGIERDPEFWRLIYDILLPGGCVFAFSGSRTGHWQACAMETAGFIMHPMHGWTFGSGFPKAHNAARAIDKALGMTGGRGEPKAGHKGHMGKDNVRSLRESGTMAQDGGFSRPWMSDPEAVENSHYRYAPGSPEAAQWEGWAYGTQTQKPALEPIYLAQKPFSEKTGAANLLKHGVGAFNIDGCRVPTTENLNGGAYAKTSDKELEDATSFAMGVTGAEFVQPTGRHPANLFHDNSPEVVELFPDSKGQQGDLKSHSNTRQSPNGIFGGMRPALDHPARNDSGSAARFFNSFPISDEDIEAIQPFFYQPKATKSDRAGSRHPTVKPIALMQHLIRHITPIGGTVLDPFAGSGTTGEAAKREGVNCILMEAEPEYLEFLQHRFAPEYTDDLW